MLWLYFLKPECVWGFSVLEHTHTQVTNLEIQFGGRILKIIMYVQANHGCYCGYFPLLISEVHIYDMLWGVKYLALQFFLFVL